VLHWVALIILKKQPIEERQFGSVLSHPFCSGVTNVRIESTQQL
jgi:hypothetical protein